jgi:hypothetical protein
MRCRLLRHFLINAVPSAGVPDRGRHARQRCRDAGRRSPALALRGYRLLRRHLTNAGLFLFNAATGLVELVSIGPKAPAALLTSIVTSGVTAFLIIMAMTFGLILPRMLFERVLPSV